MLSEKTIRNHTPDEFIEMLFEVVKWMEIFNEAGESIFGDDYMKVLAFVGLPLPSLVDQMERIAQRGDEMVKKIHGAKSEELMRSFGIRLEGDKTKPN